MDDLILRLEGITKDFPGTRAVDNVSFALRRGEVHGLVGANGAGKSTLVKIISGAVQKDAGEIYLESLAADIHGPREAIDLGIFMVYQELDLVPMMSGSENIFLGQGQFRNRLGLIQQREKNRAAAAILQRLEVDIDPSLRVQDLTISHQQLIAIAKAMSRKAKIIVFDEPTSALTEREKNKLFEVIRGATREGTAIVLITHRLDEVFEVADRVSVMRDGRLILTQDVESTSKPELIAAMIGRSADEIFPERQKTHQWDGDVVLEVERLSSRHFQDVSFQLRKGEVLGITGLLGCGDTHVARAVYGAERFEAGVIRYQRRPFAPGSPAESSRRGMAFVPENRAREGLVLTASVRDNITLTILRVLKKFLLVRRQEEERVVNRIIERLRIVARSPLQPIRTLSGGNQQKVVLAKWLVKSPELLILCEPTRGIDVTAKAEIHRIVADLATQGIAIIVTSSELDEIVRLCDRVIVLYEGKLSGEFAGSAVTKANILNAMYGMN